MYPPESDSERSSVVRRREVVRLAGAAAVGSVAFAGTASAHEVDCLRFCGGGRMVAYGNLPGQYPVLVAKEGGGPGPADLDEVTVTGDETGLEFTQRGRGKILAIVIEDEDFGNFVWYNPNQVAMDVFDEYGGVRQTVNDYFGTSYDDDEIQAGETGHCHPPEEQRHELC